MYMSFVQAMAVGSSHFILNLMLKTKYPKYRSGMNAVPR